MSGNNIQLTEDTIRDLSDAAEDAAEKVRAAGRAVSGENDLDLSGWDTAAAIGEVVAAWSTKVSSSARKWDTHSANLQYTATSFVATDDDNELLIAPQGTY